jgi:ribosomal protein L11 methyltransferase
LKNAASKSLWQISISTSGEAEEALGFVLENLFQTSASAFTDFESGQTVVSLYLTKLSGSVATVRAQITAALKQLRSSGLNPGSGKITIKKVRRENWAESWKRHFKPIEVGRALLIKPSWSRRRPRKHQAVVVLDPGLSFGTGQHATTLFCLEQLVANRRADAKQSFLDIGTGSGILAIAAAKLGYSPVQAFDFDPEAVRISRANARQNRVEDQVHPAQKDLKKLPQQSRQKFDVLCANLIYDLLVSDAEKICQRLKPDGHLILAGILQTQFKQVQKAYAKLGFKLIASRVEKEWQSGEFVFQGPGRAARS